MGNVFSKGVVLCIYFNPTILGLRSPLGQWRWFTLSSKVTGAGTLVSTSQCSVRFGLGEKGLGRLEKGREEGADDGLRVRFRVLHHLQ